MSIGEEVVRVRSPAGPWKHQIVHLNKKNMRSVGMIMASRRSRQLDRFRIADNGETGPNHKLQRHLLPLFACSKDSLRQQRNFPVLSIPKVLLW